MSAASTYPVPRTLDLARLHYESWGFKRRLEQALLTVGAALAQARRPYVAFSGGKDSAVVLSLVQAVRPDVPLLWSDDELELPETAEMMTRLKEIAGEQMIITLGWTQHAGWFWPWRDKPYWREPLPGALYVGQDVDDWMGQQGYDLTLLGTRANENAKRRQWLEQVGPLYRVRGGTGLRCCPIADWSEDDVWALIAGWGLAYNPAYDVMEAVGIPRKRQRVGPLPLAPRSQLEAGWPDLLERLEARYGRRWPD